MQIEGPAIESGRSPSCTNIVNTTSVSSAWPSCRNPVCAAHFNIRLLLTVCATPNQCESLPFSYNPPLVLHYLAWGPGFCPAEGFITRLWLRFSLMLLYRRVTSPTDLALAIQRRTSSGDNLRRSHRSTHFTKSSSPGVSGGSRRLSKFLTVADLHRFPLAVRTPQSFSAVAIARNVLVPSACAFLTKGPISATKACAPTFFATANAPIRPY